MSRVDWEAATNKLLPVLLMVALQLWAVLGSAHHPISMPRASTVSAAIVAMVPRSKELLNPVWPIPTALDVGSADWQTCGRFGVGVGLRASASTAPRSEFYNPICPWLDKGRRRRNEKQGKFQDFWTAHGSRM